VQAYYIIIPIYGEYSQKLSVLFKVLVLILGWFVFVESE